MDMRPPDRRSPASAAAWQGAVPPLRSLVRTVPSPDGLQIHDGRQFTFLTVIGGQKSVILRLLKTLPRAHRIRPLASRSDRHPSECNTSDSTCTCCTTRRAALH